MKVGWTTWGLTWGHTNKSLVYIRNTLIVSYICLPFDLNLLYESQSYIYPIIISDHKYTNYTRFVTEFTRPYTLCKLGLSFGHFSFDNDK